MNILRVLQASSLILLAPYSESVLVPNQVFGYVHSVTRRNAELSLGDKIIGRNLSHEDAILLSYHKRFARNGPYLMAANGFRIVFFGVTPQYDQSSSLVWIFLVVIAIALRLSTGLYGTYRSTGHRCVSHGMQHHGVFRHLFLDPQTEALLGDLEERHALMRTKLSKPRADLWYWHEALRSLAPLAWAWLLKKVRPVWERLRP